MNDWIALIAFNVTVIGLSSLAEKRTVIGIEYGKYLLDQYKLLGIFRVYHLLVAAALINAASLVVMLHWIDCPVVTTMVFLLLILCSWFVLFYLFAYVLRVHPKVKKSIYRKQLLGLYYDSDTPCDFEGDRIIGMPPGDRTSKKITSDVQSFFNRFNEETIAAFHEVFGPTSVVYARDRRTMREWNRLGYNPHDYHVRKRDPQKTPTSVLHISWEFFQMFRYSELQDRWLLEILNIFNGSYANSYPRLRLYNIAVVFGQINKVGFAEGLFRYKFLEYMMPHIEEALTPAGDDYKWERVEVEKYFHTQFGKYIHDTMRSHPAETFTQSSRKALSAMISVEKFVGVVPVKERIICYQNEDIVEDYNTLLNQVIAAWNDEVAQIKNIVLDFGNVLIGWNPDNLYKPHEDKPYFKFECRYQKFLKDVLSPQWLRELDSEKDMHDIIEKRCSQYPLFKKALRLYESKWMNTLSGEIAGMDTLIHELPGHFRLYGLSNWCESTFLKARNKYPILQQVSDYLISGGLTDEKGYRIPSKPDQKIFEFFLKKFNLQPGECLLIDDTRENVESARQLGMKALRFVDSETLRLALDPLMRRIVKWGENKAVWMAPDIQSGLDPAKVVIDSFDSKAFFFDEKIIKDVKLKNDFVRYDHSAFSRTMKSLPKYMLEQYSFASEDGVLHLGIKRTDWKYCQFVWHHRYDGYENSTVLQKAWANRLSYDHLAGHEDGIHYPNSLCLHLVIETADGNVVMTKISKRKTNDYPGTSAVTIGEQIEKTDFLYNNKLRVRFIPLWIKRAVKEEFGVSGADYAKLFDESSIRVLSLNLEGDIFNFALVCTIKLRVGFADFKHMVKLDKNELSDVNEMPLDAIPGILLGYPYNESEYHPSSYMRLLPFFLYKKGPSQVCQELSNGF